MVHTGAVSSRRTASCIAFLMCLVLAGAASSAVACTPSASISVSPAAGARGSATNVRGSGFEREVELRWNSMTGTVLGRAEGPSFYVSLTIPDVQPGVYYIVGIGRSDGDVRGTAKTAFEVTAPPATTTTTTTTTTTGQPAAQPSAQQPEARSDAASSQSTSERPAADESRASSPSPSGSGNMSASASTAGEPAKGVAAVAAAPALPAGTAPASGSGPAEPLATPPPPDSARWGDLEVNEGDLASALASPALESVDLPTQPVRSETSMWQWGLIPLALLMIAVWLDVRRRGRHRRGFS